MYTKMSRPSKVAQTAHTTRKKNNHSEFIIWGPHKQNGLSRIYIFIHLYAATHAIKTKYMYTTFRFCGMKLFPIRKRLAYFVILFVQEFVCFMFSARVETNRSNERLSTVRAQTNNEKGKKANSFHNSFVCLCVCVFFVLRTFDLDLSVTFSRIASPVSSNTLTDFDWLWWHGLILAGLSSATNTVSEPVSQQSIATNSDSYY